MNSVRIVMPCAFLFGMVGLFLLIGLVRIGAALADIARAIRERGGK